MLKAALLRHYGGGVSAGRLARARAAYDAMNPVTREVFAQMFRIATRRVHSGELTRAALYKCKAAFLDTHGPAVFDAVTIIYSYERNQEKT